MRPKIGAVLSGPTVAVIDDETLAKCVIRRVNFTDGVISSFGNFSCE